MYLIQENTHRENMAETNTWVEYYLCIRKCNMGFTTIVQIIQAKKELEIEKKIKENKDSGIYTNIMKL